jgi:hypothetical protein
MALVQVSQQVLTAVFTRLSDPAAGFNPGIVNNAPNYNLPPNFVQLDFTGTSSNFYFAQIDPALLETTGLINYPFGCLYIKESAQTGEQRFTQFSGIVRCIFEVHLSWVPIKGLQNHEAYSCCVEDVVIDVINRVQNQNWGKPLVYNGQIQTKRGPLIYGAQNFKQVVGFSMMFGYHQ